jgi:hypothetical protein
MGNFPDSSALGVYRRGNPHHTAPLDPRALRASFRVKALKKEMESFQTEAKRRIEEAKEESKKKPPEKQS